MIKQNPEITPDDLEAKILGYNLNFDDPNNLRGESGLYKILGEGKSAVRSRLVDEVSKYKDIPEDDNKNYIKAESLAKPDIGGGKPARPANKKTRACKSV